VCFLAGPTVLILVAIGIYSALRTSWPRWPLVALPFALITELCALVVIPTLPIWHLELVENLKYMGSMEHRLETWDREHGRFSLTQDELNVRSHSLFGPAAKTVQGRRLLLVRKRRNRKLSI